jgi:hypothetical protein
LESLDRLGGVDISEVQILGMLDPEDGGTIILRNARDYSPSDK